MGCESPAQGFRAHRTIPEAGQRTVHSDALAARESVGSDEQDDVNIPETQPAVQNPKRRRFQYSLRTLLLVVLLGGPVIGWIGIAVKNHLCQPTDVERAMQWLKDHDRPEEHWSESVIRLKTSVGPAVDGNSLRNAEPMFVGGRGVLTKENKAIRPTNDERQSPAAPDQLR